MPMTSNDLCWVLKFIWRIADDALLDLYERE